MASLAASHSLTAQAGRQGAWKQSNLLSSEGTVRQTATAKSLPSPPVVCVAAASPPSWLGQREPKPLLQHELPQLSAAVSSTLQKANTPASKLWWRSLFALPVEDPYTGLVPRSSGTGPRNAAPSMARLSMARKVQASCKPSSSSEETMGRRISHDDWRAVRLEASEVQHSRQKTRQSKTWQETVYSPGISSRLAQS